MELPFQILRPFLGARIIKTGLAVFLSLAAFHWLGSGYGTFAAVAAILAVQPSVVRAKQVFAQQLVGNLIGGVIGAVLGYWLGPTALAMSLAVVLVLGICTRLGLTDAASLAVVAVIFIMDRPHKDFLFYTAARVGAISGGMLIGYLVNRYIRPPQFTLRLRDELLAASAEVDQLEAHLLAHLSTPDAYTKEEIKSTDRLIEEHLETARYYLDLHRESHPGNAALHLAKATASLFVFMERLTDMHKIILQAGGLVPGEELGAVAAALKSTVAYKNDVLAALFSGNQPSPDLAHACAESIAGLEALVETLIDQPETRLRGLALHSVLTNIRHMSWRMDSLTRLLAEVRDS